MRINKFLLSETLKFSEKTGITGTDTLGFCDLQSHEMVSQKAGLCRFWLESVQNCDPGPCAETGKHTFLYGVLKIKIIQKVGLRLCFFMRCAVIGSVSYLNSLKRQKIRAFTSKSKVKMLKEPTVLPFLVSPLNKRNRHINVLRRKYVVKCQTLKRISIG